MDFNKDIFSQGISNVPNVSVFNTKDLLTPKDYTDDDFIESIYTLVESILKEMFPHSPQKQRVKKTPSGLNFACPFCGDSAVSATRKRGHIIMNGKYKGHYKCFNCGQYMSISNFMRKWHKELDLGQVEYLSKNTSTDYRTTTRTSSGSFSDSSVIDMEVVRKYAVDKQTLMRYGLKPVDKCSQAGSYLIGRLQFDFDNYMYDEKGKWLVILNRIDDNTVIGFQVRDMTGKRKNKYMTMTLSKIHSTMIKDNVEIPVWLDNISTIFNLFRINFRKPVIVTEGPFDANLLPNAIALSGANKSYNGLPGNLYYMFDDDETGRNIAVSMLDKGHKVFLWNKFKRDFKIPYRKKWDVNDVIKYFHENNIMVKPRWIDYFTDDMLDTIDI